MMATAVAGRVALAAASGRAGRSPATGAADYLQQRRNQDARFEAQPNRDGVLHVLDCRFFADAADIMFIAGAGTAKTHMSIALGMARRQHAYRMVVRNCAAELVTQLQSSVDLLASDVGHSRRATLTRSTGPAPDLLLVPRHSLHAYMIQKG